MARVIALEGRRYIRAGGMHPSLEIAANASGAFGVVEPNPRKARKEALLQIIRLQAEAARLHAENDERRARARDEAEITAEVPDTIVELGRETINLMQTEETLLTHDVGTEALEESEVRVELVGANA